MTALVLASAAAIPGVPGQGQLLRSFAGITVVLGLLIALAWLARRGNLGIRPARIRVPMTVESAVPLGERRSLVVVEVEGRRLLLGMTPVQVSLLTELSAREAEARFDDSLERHFKPEGRV